LLINKKKGKKHKPFYTK